jgi:hypothetical protein
MSNTTKILQDLYDSEINFSITTLWDGGMEFKLGDMMNGFDTPMNAIYNFDEGVEYLKGRAISEYPDSTFTRNYAHPERAGGDNNGS